MPGISVIVLAHDDVHNVASMLPRLLNQDYDGEYEVIIVNDGARDAMDAISEACPHAADRVRLTFVPNEAYNLSRRKLAITLGAKAARHPYIIILDTACRVTSDMWLSSMGRHFGAGRQVVLGYRCFSGKAGAIVTTDYLIENVTWMSAAIGGHPYRGCDVNLGYSRRLFFDNKGFARSLNLHGGDSDLFIKEIANADNCCVELADPSIVTDGTHSVAHAYHDLRASHSFTGRRLPKRFRRYIRIMTAMLWVSIALSIATGILTWPRLLPVITVSVMALTQWIVAICSWRKTAAALRCRLSVGALVLGIAISPLYTVKEWFLSRRNTERNYTWYS